MTATDRPGVSMAELASAAHSAASVGPTLTDLASVTTEQALRSTAEFCRSIRLDCHDGGSTDPAHRCSPPG